MSLLLHRFDLLLEAPNAVKQLREIILQSAVMGRSVPQDPADEPASVLLEKIKAEKEKLVKEGKLKPENPLPPISEEEKPYALPIGWEWVRLRELGIINPRNYANDETIASFVPMALISDKYEAVVKSELRLWKEIKNGFTHFKDNDVCLAKITPCFENGKSAIMSNLKNGIGAGTTELHVFRPIISDIKSKYIYIYLKSPKFISEGTKKMTGSAGQKRVPKDYFANNYFPLPPSAEQVRIVEKVDRLMALCDQLETQRAERDQSRVSLNNACIHRLLNSPEPREFQENWQRIAGLFPILYTKPGNVEKLKQAILQLAVMGKLVPQDQADEPASVLLGKIKAEKERRIAEGTLKPETPLPPISEEEKPYPLPIGWEWVRLQHVISFEKNAIKRGPFGSSIKKAFFVSHGYKVYEQKHAIYNDFSLGHYYITEEKYNELKQFTVKPKDIIISCSGTVGKLAIAPESIEPGIINQALLKICLNETILRNEFFLILFPAFFMTTDVLNDLKGTAQKNITSVNTLNKILFPLPPLSEQVRIVEKVDELMGLCDGLIEGLAEAETLCDTLFRSIAFSQNQSLTPLPEILDSPPA